MKSKNKISINSDTRLADVARVWRDDHCLKPSSSRHYLQWVRLFKSCCRDLGIDETSQLTLKGATTFAKWYTRMPVSLATTSGDADSGGDNLATALFLNASLYLAIFLPLRPCLLITYLGDINSDMGVAPSSRLEMLLPSFLLRTKDLCRNCTILDGTSCIVNICIAETSECLNNMKNCEIEKVINTFTQIWILKDEVIGGVLMGSYAMGLSTHRSDIDLHFLLQDNVQWKERGNRIINGLTVEYFATPVTHLKILIERDNNIGKRVYARMLAQSKLLFDKTGDTAKLQIYARNELDRQFEKPNVELVEFQKYHIWDEFNKLALLREHIRVNFEFDYYCFLDLILRYYAKFVGAEILVNAKIDLLFNDGEFREKYNISAFPDNQFIGLFLRCLKLTGDIGNIAQLKDYVIEEMGGFEIDGWILRTSIVCGE